MIFSSSGVLQIMLGFFAYLQSEGMSTRFLNSILSYKFLEFRSQRTALCCHIIDLCLFDSRRVEFDMSDIIVDIIFL